MYGSNGQKLRTLCLLDTGSNATLVLQALAEKIDYSGELGEISLGGINTSELIRSFTLELLRISGVGKRPRRYTAFSALTVPALNNPGYVVDWPPEKHKHPHLQNLPLQRFNASQIGIVLGLPDDRLQMPLECREGPRGTPSAIRTKLGWVAFSHVPGQSRSFQVCHANVEQDLESSLSIREHFENWLKGEQVPVPKQKMASRSAEDERAFRLLEVLTR